jgi:hypothetical protein
LNAGKKISLSRCIIDIEQEIQPIYQSVPVVHVTTLNRIIPCVDNSEYCEDEGKT